VIAMLVALLLAALVATASGVLPPAVPQSAAAIGPYARAHAPTLFAQYSRSTLMTEHPGGPAAVSDAAVAILAKRMMDNLNTKDADAQVRYLTNVRARVHENTAKATSAGRP